MAEMMMNNVEKYLQSAYKKVEGWYSKSALELIAKLSEVQNRQAIAGAMCEIGVHHGRAFIMLALLAKDTEICVAIDLFDNQQENIDNSGSGNKEAFLRNLRANQCDMSRIKILSENSLNLQTETLLGLSEQRFRIFSIDGGHTSEIVQNDLRLAESVLSKGGIIIVDDFFDEKWPGVSEGTLRYLLSNESNLKPFSIFDNKIVFTNDSDLKDKYIAKLSSLVPKYIVKESVFLGQKCLILYSSGHQIKNRLRQTKLWQIIKRTRFSRFFR